MTDRPARVVDYETAVDYLLSFADFERSSNARREAERFALTRITSLLDRVGRPQDGRLTVHVAGSKGKGSTAAMIEAVCRAAGLRTGLYTSPDLHGKAERIRIDGDPLAEDEFAALVERLRPVIDEELAESPGRLSTFEILTAMGFVAFRDAGVDVQVIEVGLGGRLDTTNVFREKAVGVITSLSREHTDVLGDSMEKIAAEKAGILTAGTAAAVLAPQRSAAAARVVREHAADIPVPLVDVAERYLAEPAGPEWLSSADGQILGQWFRITRRSATGDTVASTLHLLGLLGLHQVENAAAAVAALDCLRDQGVEIPLAAYHHGLATVAWPARLEVVGHEPWVLIDCAHNEESLVRVLESLPEYFDYERLVFVFGMLGDKDLEGMADRLRDEADAVVLTRPDHPRALPADRVAEAFDGWPGVLHVESSVDRAVDRALAAASSEDLVCIIGSLFTAAEARALLTRELGGRPASARVDQ